MDQQDVADLIEAELPAAQVTVSRPRGVEDDDHLAAEVVSPAFEGKSLVEQHELVYDALGEHMTTDIHALELSTHTPEQYDG
ncbi:BolA family protein [Natranaeroarchaeum aerophilus]|uniref:BolA family transcriptional regulator n=1 Tax=Natranaeroarchaeum aerophilus TaxID=2917711 RepID=A0AAE3FNH1_9EURY|nr:BolA family protein [Natranaeroarchaeum aerophilus]MCL9812483.1 BolA family transcriptional regulator [Natranaeroarchaeum aerophilus]